MTTRERTERLLNDLDVLCRVAEAGAIGAELLEDTVTMHRTRKAVSDARTIMRRVIFDLEDAEKYAENTSTCSSCGTVHPAGCAE